LTIFLGGRIGFTEAAGKKKKVCHKHYRGANVEILPCWVITKIPAPKCWKKVPFCKVPEIQHLSAGKKNYNFDPSFKECTKSRVEDICISYFYSLNKLYFLCLFSS
jgi:hypothetical protein